MKRKIIGLLLLTLTARVMAAEDLPTADQLQKLEDDKNWTDLLKGTTRVLALKGTPAAAAYNRVDIWMLKGEAQLQSNQFSAASESFTHAAAEKGIAPDQSDLALATAAVVKKSDHKGYIPKATKDTPHPPTFDIFDKTKRKDAIAALLGAESDDLTKKIDKLKTSLDQRALTDLLKQVTALVPLDRVANSSSTETDALQKSICDNFVTAVQTWSDTDSKALDDLDTIANKVQDQRYRDRVGNVQIRQSKAGLTSTQQGQVRQIQNDAKRLAGVYQGLADVLPDTGKPLIDPAKANIQKVFDQADTVSKDAVRPVN